jgi:hypothetical protein
MPISPSLRGLSQAISGPQGYDPFQQFDQQRQAQYATEDQNPDPLAGTPGHASPGMMQFNRMQQDAAVGPQGYNRQYVPALPTLSGLRATVGIGGAGNPRSLMDAGYSDYGTGADDLQSPLARSKGLK